MSRVYMLMLSITPPHWENTAYERKLFFFFVCNKNIMKPLKFMTKWPLSHQGVSMTYSEKLFPPKAITKRNSTINAVYFVETRRAILGARTCRTNCELLTNHCKRKADYRALYTILKRKGLWRDPIYVQRKEALGCYIDDVREVMPVCVVEDVRKRWPNLDRVPYCGHRRTWRKL